MIELVSLLPQLLPGWYKQCTVCFIIDCSCSGEDWGPQLPNQPNQFLGPNSSPGPCLSLRITGSSAQQGSPRAQPATARKEKLNSILSPHESPGVMLSWRASLPLYAWLYELSLAEVPVIVGGSMAPSGPDTAVLGLVGGARGNNLDLTTNSRQSWLCYCWAQ